MDLASLIGFSYCVIGDPIDHSRSPVMQNAAFAALGMGDPYGRCQVHSTEIDDFLIFARKNLRGVNVTVPLKEKICIWVDELDPLAKMIRSVNTLKILDGKIFGKSTDGEGVRRSLAETLHFSAAGKKILFLGAGGAARAASFALALDGAAAIFFLNRSIDHAALLAQELQTHFPALKTDAALYTDRANVKRFFFDADLIIQSTSLGWHDGDPQVLDIPETGASFFDFVYRDTPFLRTARERGLPAADGKSMLLYQGAASFEWWTDRPAPLDVMRRALEEK